MALDIANQAKKAVNRNAALEMVKLASQNLSVYGQMDGRTDRPTFENQELRWS